MTPNKIIAAACKKYGVPLDEFSAKKAKRGCRKDGRPNVAARRAVAKTLFSRKTSLSEIARILGYSGPSPVRYLITGKR